MEPMDISTDLEFPIRKSFTTTISASRWGGCEVAVTESMEEFMKSITEKMGIDYLYQEQLLLQEGMELEDGMVEILLECSTREIDKVYPVFEVVTVTPLLLY